MAKPTRNAPKPSRMASLRGVKYEAQKIKTKPGQGPRDAARKELGITTRFTESTEWEDPIKGHTGPNESEVSPLDQVNEQIDQEAMLEQISNQVANEMDDYNLDDDEDEDDAEFGGIDLEDFGLNDDTTTNEEFDDDDTTTEERHRIEEANEGHRFGNDMPQLFKSGTTWGIVK